MSSTHKTDGKTGAIAFRGGMFDIGADVGEKAYKNQ